MKGNDDREDRPDGTGAQTGGQGACIQYELCDAHYRSYLSSQQSKVHSVIQAERRTASGGDRCGRQPGKNQIVNLDETIDDEQILKLNLLLNTQLNGLTIEEISLGMIPKLKEQAGIHSGVVKYRIRCGGRCHCSGR